MCVERCWLVRRQCALWRVRALHMPPLCCFFLMLYLNYCQIHSNFQVWLVWCHCHAKYNWACVCDIWGLAYLCAWPGTVCGFFWAFVWFPQSLFWFQFDKNLKHIYCCITRFCSGHNLTAAYGNAVIIFFSVWKWPKYCRLKSYFKNGLFGKTHLNYQSHLLEPNLCMSPPFLNSLKMK